MSRLRIVAFTTAALFMGGLAAQRDRGPMIAAPVAFTVAGGGPAPGGTAVAGRIYGKKAGFSMPPATTIGAGPMRPVFDMSQILPGIDVEVDAMSIGLDDLPLNSSCALDYQSNAWGVLLLGVQQDGNVSHTAPVIASEKTRMGTDGAGADIFSYVYPSGNLHPSFEGRTQRALDGREIGFSTPAATGQIMALDAQIMLYSLDDAIVDQLPRDPCFYFSVTSATANRLVDPTMWGGLRPSGATILCVQWDPVAGMWQPRPPLYTWRDLGLPAAADIDALIRDEDRGVTVFSLTKATTPPGRSQLLLVEGCSFLGPAVTNFEEVTADGSTAEVAGTEGTSNGGSAGTGDEGDVTSGCSPDPGFGQTSPSNYQRASWSTPIYLSLPGVALPTLDGAAYRDCDSAGLSTFSFHLTGGDSTLPAVLHLPLIGNLPAIPRSGAPGAGSPTSVYLSAYLGPGASPLPPNLLGATFQAVWITQPMVGPLRISPVMTLDF